MVSISPSFIGKILLATFTLLTASFVRAQKPGDILDLNLEDLVSMKVSTASKKSERLSDAPATVYVITRKDIRLRGYSVLSDVLRDLPGMETIENYFSEEGTLVPVRGVVGNNKIVVLMNGVRLNPPGGENMMFRKDLSVRMAEQIEVIYGPGSTLYGQDAISAVINIITNTQPSANQLLGSAGNHKFYEGFASFASTISKDQEDPVTFSGFFQHSQSDLTDLNSRYRDWWKNYQDVLNQTRPDAGIRRWDEGSNAMLRVENERSSIQAWYRESSRSSSEGGLTPILLYVDEAEWHDRSIVLQGKHSIPISEVTDLESSLSFNRYEIDPETRYVFLAGEELFLNDFKYGLGTGFTLEEKIDTQITDEFNLIAGFEGSHYDILPKSTVPGRAKRGSDIAAQAGSLAYYTRENDPTSLVEMARATELSYQSYGVYLEGNYKPTENLKFILGSRYDYNSRFNATPLSPRAAAIYSDPNTYLTAKYIFSKAFVAPAPYFGYNVFDNGSALNITNPDLEPERAVSNEINLTWARHHTLIGTSLYYNKQSNLILVGDLSLPANVVDDEVFVDPAGQHSRVLTRSVNGGESTAMGLDVYARYNGAILSPWASFSYVDYESNIGNSKAGLPQISRVNVRAGVAYQITDALSFTPSVIYRSTPPNVTQTFGLENELKNPYEINVHLLYTPIENLDLFVDIRNLTDNKSALRGLLGPVPQEALSVKAGLRYTF